MNWTSLSGSKNCTNSDIMHLAQTYLSCEREAIAAAVLKVWIMDEEGKSIDVLLRISSTLTEGSVCIDTCEQELVNECGKICRSYGNLKTRCKPKLTMFSHPIEYGSTLAQYNANITVNKLAADRWNWWRGY